MPPKYNQYGYVGLENLGNTCFLNSCLQALSHTYELNMLLDVTDKRNNNDDSKILDEWNELRKTIWENNGVISPNKFVTSVQSVAKKKAINIFTGWSQNDISEFLLFMLDCIHNSFSRPVSVRVSGKKENGLDELAIKCYDHLKDNYGREYSEIMDMFYGLHVMELLSIDHKTHHVIKPEQYFITDLPIPTKENITIYDCFDLYTEEEKLQGDNAWYNEKTKMKEDIIKRTRFWNFPNVMVITLARFSADGTNKRKDNIRFPLDNLDLSKYVCGYKPKSYVYELYAICNHSGGVFRGHYTAFVKNYTGNWFLFNDSIIQKVADPSSIITPMAYCLFYRKKNTTL